MFLSNQHDRNCYCWEYATLVINDNGRKRTFYDLDGKKARLKYDFDTNNATIFFEGFTKELCDVKIPKGFIGNIKIGQEISEIFNYGVEWPLQFDLFVETKNGSKYLRPYTIGVPHSFVELVDKNKRW